MANPTMYPLSSLLAGGVAITGQFAPQGSSAPTITQGRGFTVSRVSTGLYKIFPAQAYRALISAQASLQLASGGAPIKATLTVTGGSSPNGDVLFTAATGLSGPDGNNISVTFLGGMSQSLAVTLVGLDVTVQLATDSGSLVTSTGAQVTTAVNLVAGMSEVVVASNPGTGASISAAHAKANLSGGAGASVQMQVGPVSNINSASGYIEVRAVDSTTGAVADIAANANNQVNFTLVFTNSSVDA